MKLEVGKTYKNRKGQEVNIVGDKNISDEYPFVGWIDDAGEFETFTAAGSYYANDIADDGDLISEVDQLVTVYANIFHDHKGVPETLTYVTAEEAEAAALRSSANLYYRVAYPLQLPSP